MSAAAQAARGLLRRIGDEMTEYFILSFYLYVCFGAILLYASSLLRARGVDYEPYGFAVVKALILAKFILIGRVVKLGSRFADLPLICSALYKSTATLLFIVLLSAAEEIIAGFLHGRPALVSISRIGGGNALQILATGLLLWLILLPVVTVQELICIFGREELYRLLWRRVARPEQ